MVNNQLTNADVTRLRNATPGIAQHNTVHFNNAGMFDHAVGVDRGPHPAQQETLQATIDYLQLEGRVGGYEAVAECQAELQRPYSALALLLNCDPSEIAIVSSATEAWQQVVYGMPLKSGDRILTCTADYGSNRLALLQLRTRLGIQIEVIPDTAVNIDLHALEHALASQPKPVLVAINHIPTGCGRVYDAHGVGRLCRRHNVAFLLDACQSVGHLSIDVAAVGCTFLTATSRKYLRGPRGAGFVYVSRDALRWHEPGRIDVAGASWSGEQDYCLQPSARRYEQYEMSMAAKVGLGVAVQQAVSLGIDRIWQRIDLLSRCLRSKLGAVPGVRLHDPGEPLCGIVTFSKEGLSAEAVQVWLSSRGVNVSVSAITSNRTLYEAAGLQAVVRASVHVYNTEEEIQMLVNAVASMRERPPACVC